MQRTPGILDKLSVRTLRLCENWSGSKMDEENRMDVGVQPLDAIMKEGNIRNHDLVAAMPPGFINHKQVQKARRGRRLTPHMQDKVLKALNACCAPASYLHEEVFNYRGNKKR
jgi:hypothetical protein